MPGGYGPPPQMLLAGQSGYGDLMQQLASNMAAAPRAQVPVPGGAMSQAYGLSGSTASTSHLPMPSAPFPYTPPPGQIPASDNGVTDALVGGSKVVGAIGSGSGLLGSGSGGSSLWNGVFGGGGSALPAGTISEAGAVGGASGASGASTVGSAGSGLSGALAGSGASTALPAAAIMFMAADKLNAAGDKDSKIVDAWLEQIGAKRGLGARQGYMTLPDGRLIRADKGAEAAARAWYHGDQSYQNLYDQWLSTAKTPKGG